MNSNTTTTDSPANQTAGERWNIEADLLCMDGRTVRYAGNTCPQCGKARSLHRAASPDATPAKAVELPTPTPGETMHHATPWSYSPDAGEIYAARPVDGARRVAILATVSSTDPRNNYTLQRAVECVNACEGIADPPDLPCQRDGAFAALADTEARLIEVARQRDALRAALEKIDSNAAESPEWIRRVARAALANSGGK